MLLLQLRETLGVKSGMFPPINGSYPETRITTMATSLTLDQAIDCIHAHERAYATRYSKLYVEYALLGVQTIPDADPKRLQSLYVEIVEELAVEAKDISPFN